MVEPVAERLHLVMDDPDELRGRHFLGRNEVIEQIMTTLIDAEADTKRRRSIMVESPTGRGKTWLLDEVYRRLRAAAPVVVCHLRASETLAIRLEGDQRWLRLLTQVMQRIRPRLDAPTLPFNEFDPATPLDQVYATLDRFQVHNLIPEVVRQLEESNLLLILIVDGLEEGQLEVCADFEINLLSPLFRSSHVRVLASRRSGGTPSYGWQHKHNLRSQTLYLSLGGWNEDNSPLPELPDLPPLPDERIFERQITDLILEHFERINSPISQDEAVRQRMALIANQPGIYQWSNPGINACLARGALATGEPFQLVAADLRACLEEKLRLPSVPESEEADWALLYHQLRKVVRLIQASPTPIIKPMIAETLEVDFRATSQLLNELQRRGIGVSERDGTFTIYPEFVELLIWLDRLEPT